MMSNCYSLCFLYALKFGINKSHQGEGMFFGFTVGVQTSQTYSCIIRLLQWSNARGGLAHLIDLAAPAKHLF